MFARKVAGGRHCSKDSHPYLCRTAVFGGNGAANARGHSSPLRSYARPIVQKAFGAFETRRRCTEGQILVSRVNSELLLSPPFGGARALFSTILDKNTQEYRRLSQVQVPKSSPRRNSSRFDAHCTMIQTPPRRAVRYGSDSD